MSRDARGAQLYSTFVFKSYITTEKQITGHGIQLNGEEGYHVFFDTWRRILFVNICIEDHLFQFAQAPSIEVQFKVVKPDKIELFK